MSTITGRVVRQMQSSQHVCVRSELKAFCRHSRMNLRAACYLLPVNLVSPFRCWKQVAHQDRVRELGLLPSFFRLALGALMIPLSVLVA